MKYAEITGWGKCVPPAVLSNQDLTTFMDTSDEWITSRTGIRERRILHCNFSDMAVVAARRALAAANLDPMDLDLILLGSLTVDSMCPNTASLIADELGARNAAAIDLNSACTGFLYGLHIGTNLIKTGAHKKVLVLGGEFISHYMDWSNRDVAVLFGDACGAVVLEASDTPGILATDIHADGKHVGLLCVPGHVQNGQILGDPVLKMDGQGVFKRAVGVLEATARTVLDKARLTDADLDWLVPHQANIRIIQSTAKKLKLPMENVMVTVDQHGNTSAASIPLALDAGVRGGRIQRGQTVLLEGVGGGFTWGAVLLTL